VENFAFRIFFTRWQGGAVVVKMPVLSKNIHFELAFLILFEYLRLNLNYGSIGRAAGNRTQFLPTPRANTN
jgi:hypothetical protein